MSERIESVREKMGDLRATGKGRVPGDVWEYDWQAMVFDECRIQGNNAERREWHPTQHPEAIYRRIATMSGGSSFLDLFAGTGTVFRAIQDKDVTGIEQSKLYCDLISKEHKIDYEY